MKTGLFRLNASDWVKGLVSAVIAAVIFAIGSIVNQDGFDLFNTNWAMVLNSAFKAAVAALVGYLGKNMLTDNDAHETVAGIIPTK